jgi:hypothetical protein
MTKQKSHAMIPFDALEIREILRKNVPQINKLEHLADFKNLKVVSVNAKEKVVVIFYEGIASQELYPGVGEKLIEKEVISKDNLINSRIGNKGQYDEYGEVHMNLYVLGYSVRIFLKAYNPNYK